MLVSYRDVRDRHSFEGVGHSQRHIRSENEFFGKWGGWGGRLEGVKACVGEGEL